ncbi:MAG TPA: hypothetical protein VK809_08725 [Bacteroidia bacterium]|jgi:hypothetical protein|nr:hypothetical protein [Bacteroidia bacterium]
MEALHEIPGFSDYLKRYYLFNLSGGRKKVKVFLADILLVTAIKGSHAISIIYLRGNKRHKIRGHRLQEFIKITGFLIQVNKHELVSPDAVDYLDEDAIYLDGLKENNRPMYVALNRTYKKAFLDFFHYYEKDKKSK